MRQLSLVIEPARVPAEVGPGAKSASPETDGEACPLKTPPHGPKSPSGPSGAPAERALSPARATIRRQVRVERFLRGLIGPRLLVQLTENRSTMVSFSVKRGVIYLRLHAIFGEAPEHILEAIAAFIRERPPSPKVSWLIDQWIEAHRPLVKNPERGPRALPRGEVHDLQEIFERLNREYFQGRVSARITWSVAARGQKRSSIRMGSYAEDERLIRIHPALDQAFVPEYFVASVVFHEMLHELHGAHQTADGQRRVHTAAFRRDEAKFRDFALARAWEARNLHRLLRY